MSVDRERTSLDRFIGFVVRYRVRSGELDLERAWVQRSYDLTFDADNLSEAKKEIDRALRENEIHTHESGDHVWVEGPDGSACRSMFPNRAWFSKPHH